MRKILLSIILCLVALPVLADNHYVSPAGAGSKNGSDWSNAYQGLPSSLTRGDTYYLAEGNYGKYIFDDATNGTLVITIKKCGTGDGVCEAAAGYSSADHDGVATFTTTGTGSTDYTLWFSTSYYTLDGFTGGGYGAWETGHGIGITNSSPNTSADTYLVYITAGVGHITLSHVNIYYSSSELDNGAGANIPAEGIKGACTAASACDGITVDHSFIHDIPCNPIKDNAFTNFLFEENKIARNNEAATGCHAGTFSITSGGGNNHTIRYNIFEDLEGSWLAGNGDSTTDLTNLVIHNNVIYWTGNATYNKGFTNATVGTLGASTKGIPSAKVYNNTIVGQPSGLTGIYCNLNNASCAGIDVENNIFYDNYGYVYNASGQTVTHNYNYYDVAAPTGEGANSYASQSDPFTNIATFDFTLAAGATNAIDKGVDLGATYQNDLAGNVRSGSWDIGAYERGAGADTDTPDIVTAGNVTKVNTAGTTFTLVLDENVTVNDGTGFTLDCNGDTGEGLSYVSVSGGTLTFNITGRVIASGETCTLDYATTGGIVDAAANALESNGDPISVYNGSTYSPSETSYTVTPSVSTGCSISPTSAQSVPAGTTQFTCTATDDYTCTTWTTTCTSVSGTTTATVTVGADCTVTQSCKRKPGLIIGSGGSIGFGTGGSIVLSQ